VPPENGYFLKGSCNRERLVHILQRMLHNNVSGQKEEESGDFFRQTEDPKKRINILSFKKQR